MKTRPEIEVFTDKDHCESYIDKVCCDFLTTRDRKNFCSVYREYLEGCELRKCDQCKTDYQEAERELIIKYIQQNWSLNRRDAINMLEKSEIKTN